MEYKNFFENQKEAHLRLASTVVLYDGEPVEVMTVTDHVQDGILRAYVRPTGYNYLEYEALPQPNLNKYSPNHPALGTYIDEFIKKNLSCNIVRKHLSSPLFNKFRPFELGMCWMGTSICYIERQPNRSTYQGLVPSMMVCKKPSLSVEGGEPFADKIDLFSAEVKRCIKGEHPTPHRCLAALNDKRYANDAAAFHRHFALVKGPVGSMFLAYKSHIVGTLPNGDFSRLKLGQDYSYCKEVVEELRLFSTVTIS